MPGTKQAALVQQVQQKSRSLHGRRCACFRDELVEVQKKPHSPEGQNQRGAKAHVLVGLPSGPSPSNFHALGSAGRRAGPGPAQEGLEAGLEACSTEGLLRGEEAAGPAL